MKDDLACVNDDLACGRSRPNASLWVVRADDGRAGPPQELSPSFAVPSMRDAKFPLFQRISMSAR
jgi:hypothetical protein